MNTSMDSSDALRKSHLCAQLDEDELAAVGRIVSVRKVSKGQLLFLQGDTATGFYLLLSGKVRIYKASPDGKEYTLHMIHPGQMFAEVVLFQGTRYPANCIAMQDSQVAFFPKEQFLSLLENSPRMSLKMIGGLAAFVREFNQMVEDLSLKEVPARLAAFFVRERDRHRSDRFELDISKTDLARNLGTIPETLSRNLKKLREIEAVDVNGREVKILDVDRLQAIAGGEKL